MAKKTELSSLLLWSNVCLPRFEQADCFLNLCFHGFGFTVRLYCYPQEKHPQRHLPFVPVLGAGFLIRAKTSNNYDIQNCLSEIIAYVAQLIKSTSAEASRLSPLVFISLSWLATGNSRSGSHWLCRNTWKPSSRQARRDHWGYLFWLPASLNQFCLGVRSFLQTAFP